MIMSSSLIEGFDVYIQTELGLSKSTIEAYTRDVQEFISFIRDKKLTACLVEQFVQHLRWQKLQPTTIRRKCMSVRCLCHHLISLGKIDNNTLAMIDPIRTERKKPNALEPQDVDALVATVENRTPVCRATNIRRDVAIILTLYHSGLRVSELCSLSLPDVNFVNRLARVKGKGGTERVVPITHRCAEAMQEYLKQERKSTDSAMFVKTNGQRVTRRAVSHMITTLSHRANVAHTTPHTLRRSCATSLVDRGVDLDLVQSLLGHQSLETTQAYLATSNDKLVRVHKKYHPFGDNNEF